MHLLPEWAFVACSSVKVSLLLSQPAFLKTSRIHDWRSPDRITFNGKRRKTL